MGGGGSGRRFRPRNATLVKVLVTGATGLIGAGVARALAARGEYVTVLQRRSSELGLAEIRADVTDAEAMGRATAGQDAVVHLAARVGVTGSWADFESANVTGTATLLSAARGAGVARFVQVSSPSVAHAGHALVGAPATPADPERARSHYARSKAMAERLALAADGENLAVVAVRPHLVWGPGDRQLVGRIVDRARRRRLALVSSGSALIDTTYLDNAVGAIVAALDRAPEVHGEVFVVSNGEPRTVAELFERICTAAGVPGPRLSIPLPLARLAGAGVETHWRWAQRSDEPPMTRFLAEQLGTAHWFDQRRTRQALHWEPAVPLDDGFNRLAQWFDGHASSPGD
jgi:2-alkyl-3-oxoalkanoate reductase